ncbi:hypothetical protein [Tenacibaculum sp. M341]|uniref:hypothetical protein n=1 Tax=Tenacibaculum sp. M341 TaxID=2530339 RepID=UPI00104612D0|nr:hypothetical protein [Tenacibaculum sp. M341]TCI94242.1 hypothetical protein EYW44_02540 [Tenacibaculum sp. M341]
MTYKLTTYKTLTGKQEILETRSKKSTEAIVYKDDEPAFLVDCFDLKTESNVQMNYLVLCQQKSMKTVINEISKKNNVNLSIKEAPVLSIVKSSVEKEVELPPLPLEWLD